MSCKFVPVSLLAHTVYCFAKTWLAATNTARDLAILWFRPSRGLVEVTIKRLQSMLLDTAIQLCAKDLLRCFADSRVSIDSATGSLKKWGDNLKSGDCIRLANETRAWKVRDFGFESSVAAVDLELGQLYDIVPPGDNRAYCYRLNKVDREIDWYEFVYQHVDTVEESVAQETGNNNNLVGIKRNLPPIFPRGRGIVKPSRIIIESVGGPDVEVKELDFDDVAKQVFEIDVSDHHVLLAIGYVAP
jgi:hypothetical protein